MKSSLLSFILMLSLLSVNSQTTYYFQSGNASLRTSWFTSPTGGTVAPDGSFQVNRNSFIVPVGKEATFETSCTFGSTNSSGSGVNLTVNGTAIINTAVTVSIVNKNNSASSVVISGTLNFLGTSQLTMTNGGNISPTFTTTASATVNTENPNGIFGSTSSIATTTGSGSVSYTFNNATNFGFNRLGIQTLNLPTSLQTNYLNLTLSGSGTKTFSSTNITLSGELRISSGVIASIPGTPTTSGVIVASKLYLNNSGVTNGIYGAAAPATTIRADFFAGSGYVSAQLSSLPVTLSNFTAKQTTDNKVSLAWVTSSESVNKGFSIERQEQGSGKFQSLGFIPSKAAGGNSQSTLAYNFKDVTAKKGTNMYRLVQEDLDGTKTYSEVCIVKLNNQSVTNVFPNPSNGAINISRTNDGKKMNIQLLDQSGRVISQVNNIIDANYRMNLPQSGIYSIKMMYPETGEQSIQRIVVQK